MKLIEAIRNVERPESQHPWDFAVPEDKLCSELDIDGFYEWPNELQERLKSYPIIEWYCTDENVGLYAIYLDGEPVGCHFRRARKAKYDFSWISSEARNKTRDVIISYYEKAQDEIELINPDDDIGEDYAVEFVTQALSDDGFYQGRPVRALVWYDGMMGRNTPQEYRREGKAYYESVDSKDPRANCVLIQDGDEIRVIPVMEFRMPFKVNKKPA